MALKNKMIVKIGGKEYTLVGVETEEYLQKVALYIDRKMNEISKINSKLSTSMAAVLTAINVADDYFKTCENEAKLKYGVEKSTSEVEKLKEELRRIKSENAFLEDRNATLQIEMAKREAELNEVRNFMDHTARQKMYIAK